MPKLELVKLISLFTLVANFSLSAVAKEVENIPEIGRHFTLFTVEKNVNPENIIVAYVKLDAGCRIEYVNKNPSYGFYWLMNKSSYKPLHPLILKEVEKRLSVQVNSPGNQFDILLTDLTSVRTDIKNPHLTVKSTASGNQCDATALMQLGPADNNAVIKLASIQTETKGFLSPKIMSVTLTGTDVASGKTISRKYLGK